MDAARKEARPLVQPNRVYHFERAKTSCRVVVSPEPAALSRTLAVSRDFFNCAQGGRRE